MEAVRHQGDLSMEDNVRQGGRLSKEIAFSRVIKAGKRIYYVDVKRSRNEEMFLSITESKKVVSGEWATSW